MNETWARLADLFAWATSLPPADRDRFLDIACGADLALRAEVEALLRADAACSDDAFLRSPIDEVLSTYPGRSPHPEPPRPG